MVMEEDIRSACEALKRGQIILYPTDTVWGIGCDATNSEAVKRIYSIKRRADHKAMIVLLSDIALIDRYVIDAPEVAFQLIEAANRPTTIIYDHGINLAPELLGDDGSIGIRITDENFSQRLCRAFRRPIVSTSANISGQAAASTFDSISDEIKCAVDYVCTYRRNDKSIHKPSSVIKIGNDGVFKIIRK